VLAQIKKCNIRNYSIYKLEGVLFSHFKYIGDDYEVDMAKMSEDSFTQKWWKLTIPMQIPCEARKENEW
jgi:L-rhamnose mutarotase